VLVRPDMHVGWRSHDERGDLAAALQQILGRR
jgi:hypothetical protein